MDSELLRKLKSRRDLVDSNGTCFERDREMEKSKSYPQAEAKQGEPRKGSSAWAHGWMSSKLRKVGENAAEETTPPDVNPSGALASIKRLGSWTSSSSEGLRAPRSSGPEVKTPAYPSLKKSVDSGSELNRRLQARREMVDSEGHFWEKLAEASVADAKISGRRKSSYDIDEGDVTSPEFVHTISKELESALKHNLTSQLEDQASPVIEATFKPGPLGMKVMNGTGEVAEVMDDSQAQQKGVQATMVIQQVCGRPFSKKLLDEKVAGKDDYAITFVQECQTSGCELGTAALANCLQAGQPLPWETLRRGTRTWVCDTWISEPLCSSVDGCRKNSNPNSTSSGGGSVEDAFALPSICCLAADGELRVCVSVTAPPGVSEEADFARLLNAYEVTSLRRISSFAAVPDALCFYFARAAKVPAESCSDDSAVRNASSRVPSLVARFESEEEAQACAVALSDFSAAPLLEAAENEFDAQLLASLFGNAVSPAEHIHEQLGADDAGEQHRSISSWRAFALSGASMEAFMTDTSSFVQELDRLAGFA